MTLLKVISLFCFPAAACGARLEQRDLPVTLKPFYGVPSLDVLFSQNVDQAMALLSRWSDARDFGLFVQRERTDNKAYFPVRVVLLGISRGNRVLILDLRPYLREVPAPLPGPLAEWLEHPSRTFFGMDLKRGAGRLAFEFDVVIRAVDFGVRSWPQLRRDAGIYNLFNHFVSDGDLWRPDSLATLSSQARHSYLQWSVAHYFMLFHGPADEDWIITMTELFESGPVYLRVKQPRHDWKEARELWIQRKQKRARFSLLDTLKVWRRARGHQSGGAIGSARRARRRTREPMGLAAGRCTAHVLSARPRGQQFACAEYGPCAL
eukprot:CAMPEP_0176209498 /NCGR_PEP_ID=MMETSP0121_2-20121125/13663_1 /TAXON_ID=160619 /ORGANISM="Kryptoperidinium foliaceum, Strain CCMP 1326" /LENGTH=320 /DNA_ID=CAMNT_0017548509 /DNA_START=59 /DNA_END=1021 /DNA_ORIENTATION=-